MQLKSSEHIIFVISIVILIITNIGTYKLLLDKNSDYKNIVKEDNDLEGKVPLIVDALSQHVYYDGDLINGELPVQHYNRSGRLLSTEKLSHVLKGEKAVLFLSTNSCSSCTENEIQAFQEMKSKIGADRMVVLTDFALHERSEWSLRFSRQGYYEVSKEHLGLKGSQSQETPVVMLTQNCRIKTSFVVGQQTSAFSDNFHKYIIDYFHSRR
jgi:hypothetical protein